MSNKYLARSDAPFGDEIWSLLDSAMIDVARSQLAGRRMLGLEGPYGLGLKMIPSADKALESLGVDRVEALEWLVQEEHLRVVHQAGDELKPLLHTLAQIAHLALGPVLQLD